MTQAPTTVLIPAFNEATVIARSLLPLADAAEAGHLQVIVIANGCADGTADVARAVCPSALVLETPIASKTHAVNLGAAHAEGRAVVCLDADLALPVADLDRLVGPILAGDADVTCGRMVANLDHSSAPVRAFYRGWQLNPYFDAGKFGGVYALSADVANDLFPLPEVVADDEYVARRTATARHQFVPEATFTVRAPATLRALYSIRRRSRRGTAALEQAGVQVSLQAGRATNGGGFRTVCTRAARRPARWGDVAVYGALMIAVRLSLKIHPAAPNAGWERDDSSRLPSTPA